MSILSLNPVRLADARPVAGIQYVFDTAPPLKHMPQIMRWLARRDDASCDIAAELVMASARGGVRNGLNIRVRFNDKYMPAERILTARDALAGEFSTFLSSLNIAHERPLSDERGTACLLPSDNIMYVRKQRHVGNIEDLTAQVLTAPAHYFDMCPDVCAFDLAAITKKLKRAQGSGISITLMQTERTAGEQTAIAAALNKSDCPPEYKRAYEVIANDACVYAYVMFVWGSAWMDVISLMQLSGVDCAPLELSAEPALIGFEAAFDPWTLNNRLVSSAGNKSMGRLAYTLCETELNNLCAAPKLPEAPKAPEASKAHEAPIAPEASDKRVSVDNKLIDELSDQIRRISTGQDVLVQLITTLRAPALSADVMAELNKLTMAINKLSSGKTDAATCADIERVAAQMRNEVVAQTREFMKEQTLITVGAQADELKSAVKEINAHTDAKLAEQSDKLRQMFTECSADLIETIELLPRVGELAGQAGLDVSLKPDDLKQLGVENEAALKELGMTDDMLMSLRYAVSLFNFGKTICTDKNADFLPYGFMISYLYEQLITTYFKKLYMSDPEREQPVDKNLKLSDFDALNDERIKRYTERVKFSPESGAAPLTHAEWVAWFNMLRYMRIQRNKVHPDAGILTLGNAECMYNALLFDSEAPKREVIDNLIQEGKARLIFIPPQFHGIFAPNGTYDYRLRKYIFTNKDKFTPSVMRFLLRFKSAEWNTNDDKEEAKPRDTGDKAVYIHDQGS